ncbi:hypothetical protein PISMIDRAFT_690594, partial [Pisolithus microcarpus 441]
QGSAFQGPDSESLDSCRQSAGHQKAENDVGALTFRSILIEEALIGSATTVRQGRLSDS